MQVRNPYATRYHSTSIFNMTLTITPAILSEFQNVTFMKRIVEAGETYALARDMSDAEVKEYFFQPGNSVYKATIGDVIVGVSYLRTNRGGGGNHVSNAGFMVSEEARGKGVARALVLHALQTAKDMGYAAIQFNFVVSTNTVAVDLWKKVGFEIIGTIPKGFDHPLHGKVDAYIMHRFL